ncbi:MAG: Maf family protein [Bacillota bacterium]
MRQIVLASASPRRRALLEQVGVVFSVDPSALDESFLQGEEPQAAAGRLALGKAASVASRHTDALVIGADTVVVAGQVMLGKPASPVEARTMLDLLAGREHRVVTGLALWDTGTGDYCVDWEESRVWMRPFSAAERDRYVATGEPLGKAGGYAIQGKGALLVERLEGCYSNVVGLPLVRLAAMLKGFGVILL